MALSSQAVHERLQITAAKFRWSRSIRFLLSGGALSLLFLLVFLTLDAWLHFGAAGRWSGFTLTISALLGGAVLAWRAWQPAISEASIARRIEQASGGAGNVLINAVQFDGALPMNSPLRAALFAEMHDPFPKVEWNKVFDIELLKKLAMILGAVVAVLLAWALLKPNYFANSAARIFLPASKIAPLTRTRIDSIIPADTTVVHGRELRLTATLAGSVPETAWVWFREAGSSWQKALLDREAGQPVFDFLWKEVRQPIDYYIEAGDVRSDTYRIAVRPRTAIKSRLAEIEAPAYTGLARQAVKDFSILQNVVPGSKLVLGFEFNNEVSELKAADDKGEAISATRVDATHWKLSATITANRTIKLDYRDEVGIPDYALLQIAVKPDESPKVTVSEPAEGKDLAATKTATLAVKFAASDAFGLGSVAIYQSTNEREDARLVEEFTAAKGQKNFEGIARIPLAPYLGDEDRVTFRVVARDANDVTGPGVTMSRPIVVSIKSQDKLAQQMDDAAAKLQKGIEALIKMQSLNLDETRAAAAKREIAPLTPLVERQAAVADGARQLVGAADLIAPDVRGDLRTMLDKEMKDAIVALRNAGSAASAPRSKFLLEAVGLERAILARLQGASPAAEEEANKAEVQEAISGLEDLLKQQRALYKEATAAAADTTTTLSDRQDALAEKASAVRKALDADSKNASVGDEDFRRRLARIAGMFGELRVYEDMLAAAESLQNKQTQPAAVAQQRVIVNLTKMVDLLNQWQIAEAADKAKELKEEAEKMQAKLEKLAEIQRDIIEKSKEMARKNEFRPEDIATAQEIQESKDLMKEVVEQMVTDMHAFPDMKPGNEMKAELVSILEEVEQQDKQDVAEGKLKPSELAVQKEQGILDAIEQAKKIAADMEMWLPNKTEKEKWLLENFDKTEMPEIPNLPLADAMEDIVGNLMDAQEDLQQEIQDAASNQAFAMNPANGWEIRDGPMPGFGAQGKSGNEKPNHNEQMGRSSGGRDGMSDGEMAGDAASNLEGDKADVRRTKDPLQQGQVKDDGGISEAHATGGGKAGGYSDRTGMDGSAPVRAVKAPPRPVTDAAAVKQALLAEKASKTVAEASLLYLRSDGLAQVVHLMDESQQALKDGRLRDAQGLHQRIIGRLRELKSGVSSGEVMSFGTQDGARSADKQLLGGSEGEAPAQYKEMVADYFRALVEEK